MQGFDKFCKGFLTGVILIDLQRVFDTADHEISLQKLNLIQDGLFRGCSWMEGGQKGHPSLKCHTYPTMMKLGTVIPYLNKIQKIYKSRDTPLEFCWHQHFSP